jgi:hypothetical protein
LQAKFVVFDKNFLQHQRLTTNAMDFQYNFTQKFCDIVFCRMGILKVSIYRGFERKPDNSLYGSRWTIFLESEKLLHPALY